MKGIFLDKKGIVGHSVIAHHALSMDGGQEQEGGGLLLSFSPGTAVMIMAPGRGSGVMRYSVPGSDNHPLSSLTMSHLRSPWKDMLCSVISPLSRNVL